MTIVTLTTSSGPYAAVAQTTFAVTFYSASASEIEVTLADVVQATNLYTFTRDTDGTGSVVFASAVTGSVIIYSKPVFSQPTSFSRFGAFYPDQINGPLDTAAAKSLYLKDRVDKLFPDSARLATSRASKFIAWDASGNPVLSSGTGADAGLRTDLAASGGSALVEYSGSSVKGYLDTLAQSVTGGASVVVRPTGFSVLPFVAWYGAGGVTQTEYDDPAVFRTAMLPSYVGNITKTFLTLYLDPDVTNIQSGGTVNNNDGKSLFYACPDWGRIQGFLGTYAMDSYVIVCKGRAKAYGRLGPGFTGATAKPYAIMGLPDDKGNRPTFCEAAPASMLTWTDNATSPQVKETPIATLLASGTFDANSYFVDVRFRDKVIDAVGDVHRVPRAYTKLTSLALVARTPGSFWWDSTGAKLYVHPFGGSASTTSPDPYEVCLISAVSTVQPNMYTTSAAALKQFYVEGIDVIGTFNMSAGLDRFAALDCRSFHAYSDSFPMENTATYTKDCVAYGARLDAFSGANNVPLAISRIYNLRPVVLSAGTLEGSQQAFSIHNDVEETTINPISSNPLRNQITDIQTSKRHMIGGILAGTRMSAPFDVAGNPNYIVNATTSAVVALDGVTIGGFYEVYTAKAQDTAQIRLRNTRLPSGTTNGDVTTTW